MLRGLLLPSNDHNQFSHKAFRPPLQFIWGIRCDSKHKDMNVLLNNELTTLLRTQRLPARLTVAQVAAVLGFQPHDIPVLVSRKLLRLLGRPEANATKYFATAEIEKLGQDPAWLAKATQAMYDHWRGKNQRARAVSDPLESELVASGHGTN